MKELEKGLIRVIASLFLFNMLELKVNSSYKLRPFTSHFVFSRAISDWVLEFPSTSQTFFKTFWKLILYSTVSVKPL